MKALHVRLIAAVIILATMVAMMTAMVPLINNTWNRAGAWRAKTIESGINRALSQCFALEGEYPAALSYLEDNYSITLDEDTYFYRYQYNGGNLRPEIWVVEK